MRVDLKSILNGNSQEIGFFKCISYFNTAVFIFSLIYVCLIFAGCAIKEEIVKPIEVKTPIKCSLPTPMLAPYRGNGQENRLKNEASIYIYAQELEITLQTCKGEK